MDTAQYQTTTVEPKEADQCSTTDVDNEPTTPVRDLSEEPLTENPFDSESSRILFDAIDQLQSCDAGQDIDIPQLVIVGGQSTGKSSLLQSLVDIPFPTGQGCCTRFATRIVSRRTAPGTKNECVVTIVKPDFDLNEYFNYDANTDYESYVHRAETLTAKKFGNVISEVEEKYMKIKPGRERGSKNFATEVLKVELSGPRRSHFSILDIPGVFENDELVTASEKDGVKRMVIEYLSKPQNIVICIADAGNDLANQGVFALARQHVEESRLVRVFTKCDNIRPTDEGEVIRRATESRVSGNATALSHGWFVVRNRRADEGADFDLATSERELFGKKPWTDIHESRRGSSMLKEFLGNLLCTRIRQEFPALQQKVKGLLSDAEAGRTALGSPRLTHGDRQRYLTEVVQRFQEAADHALSSPGCLPSKTMRVRGFVATQNRDFDSNMRHHGHWYDFEDVVEHTSDSKVNAAEKYPSQLSVFAFGQPPATPESSPRPRSRVKNMARTPQRTQTPEDEEVSEIRQDIQEQIEIFQGIGLPGLLNTDIFPVLYKTQTKKWLEMAKGHLQNIATDVIKAATSILTLVDEKCHLCPNARLGMLDILQKFHSLAHERAEQTLVDYMEKESNFPLQATNPAFIQMLEALRSTRSRNATHSNKIQLKHWVEHTKDNSEVTFENLMERVDRMISDLHFDPTTRMENEIHDVLKVHYELSLQSFIDYVTKRVIEDFISGKNGPLLGLSTKYILDLSETEIEVLAREDEITLLKREKYDEKIARLEQSCSIAEEAWRRTTPRPSEMPAC